MASSKTGLAITVRWHETIIAARTLRPGDSFSVGPQGDCVVPAALVGEDTLVVAKVAKDGSVSAGWPGEQRALGSDEQLELEAGEALTIQIGHAAPRMSRRPRLDGRLLGSMAAGGAIVAGLMALSSSAYLLPAEREDEQREVMYQILARIEARQLEEKETEEVASEDADEVEGGSGTRANGEAGSMGNPNAATVANRYGVAGPTDPSDPVVSRQAAMKDAAEFGMVGLLNSGAGASGDAAWGTPEGLAGVGLGGGGAGDLPPGMNAGGKFADYGVNAPTLARDDSQSTFAIDVDTGSYTQVRSTLRRGDYVPAEMVRPEELINYFDYGYPGPSEEALVAHVDAAPSPFASDHTIVRVGIQATRAKRPAEVGAHLVYLVDVSGSMMDADKLGLAKASLRMLTDSLRPTDTVSLVTYAGSVRLVLPPTTVARRADILAAIDDLSAEGSTAMGDGLKLAYEQAERSFVRGHINRVIVLSDGDANVGATSHEEILKSIEAQRKKGITLSTVGFGQSVYNDEMMEQLADAGDGNYQYIDSPTEAKRAFTAQLDTMIGVVARDVKIQVDFDPLRVRSYRLIGYENRDVADVDFENDAVDGGEVGPGHAATAIYDVVLKSTWPAVHGSGWVSVNLRYKPADGGPSRGFSFPLGKHHASFEAAPADMRFATAVAAMSEKLRESPYATSWRKTLIRDIADESSFAVPQGEEVVQLMDVLLTR